MIKKVKFYLLLMIAATACSSAQQVGEVDGVTITIMNQAGEKVIRLFQPCDLDPWIYLKDQYDLLDDQTAIRIPVGKPFSKTKIQELQDFLGKDAPGRIVLLTEGKYINLKEEYYVVLMEISKATLAINSNPTSDLLKLPLLSSTSEAVDIIQISFPSTTNAKIISLK